MVVTAELIDVAIEVCVLLHSRLNNLIQAYTFSNSSSESSAPVSSANATRLEITIDGEGRTTQVIMDPLPFQGDVGSQSEGLARSYLAQGLRFYKLFVIRSDLSIHEAVVYCTTQPHAKVEDIAWSKVDTLNKTVRTIGTIQEMDDFVEPEGIEALDGPLSKFTSQGPECVQGEDDNTARRVSDHTLLYDALTGKEMNTIDVAVVTAQMEQLLAENSGQSQLPLGTM